MAAAASILASPTNVEAGVSHPSPAPRVKAAQPVGPAALQAPNRAHNLRTYFGASGIRVHDRTVAESPELLSLTGLGRLLRDSARG